jgi:hypothetical protein
MHKEMKRLGALFLQNGIRFQTDNVMTGGKDRVRKASFG